MNNPEPRFWFPAKKIGWGWGPPVTWQGWVVVALYFAVLVAGISYFAMHRDIYGFAIFVVVITSLLITLMFVKGERKAT
jgi:hypothetical protein